MVNAIEKNFQEQIKKTEAIDEKIGHLTKFFKDGLLDFDVKKSKKIIYEMQIRVGQQIPNIKTTYNHKRKIEYLEKCKIAHLYKSLNFLGNISKISESEKFNYSITSSNQRLYSVFTNISKYIRPYFTYNGFPLTQLDLSSSQPLLLFHFLNELKWKKEQNFKSFLKEDKEYLLIQLYETKQPLMLDTLNGINDKKFNDELERFKKLFEGDFYINIIEEVKKCNPYSKKLKGFTNRKNCKKTIMYLLFERFTESKSKVPQYNSFKKTFPLITIVLDTLKEKQKNKVALILQNLESDLFLNNITKKISELNPDLPMFTIHDAILTTPEHVEYVNEIMTQIIINTTGVIPKISILKGNADLTEDKLNEITESYIEDIKNKVKNKKYVNEIENISTVKLGAFIKKYKFTSLFETIILDLNLDPTNLLSTINFIDSNSVFPPLKKVLNSEEANKIPDFRLNTGKIIEFK
jgi:hypothetical protein